MNIFDRLASVVLALVLLVGGALVVIEVVYTLLGKAGHAFFPYERFTSFGTAHTWNDTLVLVISGALVVVGLLVLLFELKRRRPALLTVQPVTDGVVSGMSRKSLSRALATQAEDVEGIADASARVRRRKVTVQADTTLREPGDLEQRLTQHLSGWLDGVSLVRPLKLQTSLSTKES